MNRVTDDERAAIEAALRDGQSGGKTARQFGRSIATVVGIAKRAGIALDQSATKKAVAAKVDYDQANRLQLINEFFTVTRSMLHTGAETPAQLKDLSLTLAILVDKRRLEDGEATSRSEVHDDSTRTRLGGRLDELAARRAARLDSESHRGTG
jgi:hypothetical protein